MKTINITMGNDHRLRVAMTRWDAPLALLHSSDVRVYALRSYGSRVALVRHFSSHDEGVLEAFWPSNLVQGMYGLEITGIIEGEGKWRMLAENAVCVTAATEKGGESLVMIADSYDVKATITVCEGTKGVDQELRDEIADMIEDEYNASERVREENEADRQTNEANRIQNEQGREEAEQQRSQAEQQRQQAEQQRQQTFEGNENQRQQTFGQNENQRQSDFEAAERQRQSDYTSAEQQRQSDYTSSEQQRNNHYNIEEADRDRQFVAAEDNRNNSFTENERQRQSDFEAAERQRQSDYANAERLREQAEQQRVQAEQQRQQAEQQRSQNEQGRVEAEQQRENTFATYHAEIEEFSRKIDAFEDELNDMQITEEQFNEIFN